MGSRSYKPTVTQRFFGGALHAPAAAHIAHQTRLQHKLPARSQPKRRAAVMGR